MRIGLLFFDATANKVDDKVQKAAAAYHHKFGDRPDSCHVHPDDAGDVRQVGTVTLVPDRGILRNHLWIGRKEKK